jgi:hypothetical protein
MKVAAVIAAFVSLLHARYGAVQPYATCPIAQHGDYGWNCISEFQIGETHYLVQSLVRFERDRYVPTHVDSTRWTRSWRPVAKATLAQFHVRGTAEVNGPAFDWAFLAAGAASPRKERTFQLSSLDGYVTGFEHVLFFTCTARRGVVTCTNAFGDAMRYRP